MTYLVYAAALFILALITAVITFGGLTSDVAYLGMGRFVFFVFLLLGFICLAASRTRLNRTR